MPKFRTKNALLGISDQEYITWIFLGSDRGPLYKVCRN